MSFKIENELVFDENCYKRQKLERLLHRQKSKLKRFHQKQLKLLEFVHEEKRLAFEHSISNDIINQMSRLNLGSSISPLNIGSNITQSINALTNKLESIMSKSPSVYDFHNQLNYNNNQIDHDHDIEFRPINQVDNEFLDTRTISTIQIPNIVVLPASESQLNSFSYTTHNRRNNKRLNKCQKRLSLRRWSGRSSIVSRRLSDDVGLCDYE